MLPYKYLCTVLMIYRYMKKKILTKINCLLGATSLALAGCHSLNSSVSDSSVLEPKKYGPPPMVDQKPTEPPVELRVPPEEIPVCKYGVPMPVEE